MLFLVVYLIIPKKLAMKKYVYLIVLTALSQLILAQPGFKWGTSGNASSTVDVLGTTNNLPINFITNNQSRMVLDITGNLRITNLAGTGVRLLQTDTYGNIKSLSSGANTQVLYGNGNWGDLPAVTSLFAVTGANLSLPPSAKLGIGISNPQVPLDVAGNANISGILKLSALSGTSSSVPLLVDNLGNVTRGRASDACISGAPQWSWGGDTFLPFSVVGGSVNNAEVGTCNNYEFILKSNGINRAWYQTDGTISFGSKIVSNSGGREFKFDKGALRLSGNNTFGGPQIIFDNDAAGVSPFGDWGIEYTGGSGAAQDGLNFWKPFGSVNGNNNILFLADNNRIGMGTDNPSTRLTIDAWNEDGIKVLSDPNKNAIDVFNKITGKVEFRVKSNGETYSRHIKVMITNFPDYVFEKNYKPLSLYEIETYYKENKRLPEMPSALEVETNNLDLGEINKLLVKKVEEMTILMVEMKKEIDALKTKK